MLPAPSRTAFASTLKRIFAVLCLVSASLWVISSSQIVREVQRRGDCRMTNNFPEFQDILIYKTRFSLYHTDAFYQLRQGYSSFAYPPADAPLYAALYHFARPEIPYLLLIGGWALLMSASIGFMLRPFFVSSRLAGALIAGASLLFSFPVVFLAERANVELFVWMAIVAGVVLWRRQWDIPAAMLFGLAAAWKLYPILLLGVFVGKRVRWSAVASGIAAALGASALALWYSGPTFLTAARGFFADVSRFKSSNGEAPRFIELLFDHSFFSPIKLAGLYGHLATARWAPVYYILAMVTCATLFFWRVRFQPALNRYLFLSICMVSLPPVSYEYTLIHLYAPTLFLIRDSLEDTQAAAGRPSPFTPIAITCALFLLLPFGLVGDGAFRFAGQVQVAALATLLVLSVQELGVSLPFRTDPFFP